MDQLGQWRVIAAEPDETEAAAHPPASPDGHDPGSRGIAPWQFAVALCGLVIAVVGAAIWLTLPRPAVTLDAREAAVVLPATSPGGTPMAATPSATGAPADELVVDVEGAVVHPGLVTLPAGSRVGDAISAAGGYGTGVDIAAAAAQLNLAQPLKDGDKVHVPMRGEVAVAASPPTASGDGPQTGLVDINHASADELDTLPGVGPVTAAKIISAREEVPFSASDELLSRGVVGQSTYDKLSSLITVTP